MKNNICPNCGSQEYSPFSFPDNKGKIKTERHCNYCGYLEDDEDADPYLLTKINSHAANRDAKGRKG